MIRFVNGSLAAAGEGEVIIDTGGIGYAVNVPVSLMSELPELGENLKLFTYLAVREDAMQLFGFLSYDDLTMFKMLIAVNGIGPKAALAILGTMSSEDICFAVMAEDAKSLSRAPGIGSKTAKKLILELKDKLDLAGMLEGKHGAVLENEENSFEGLVSDAVAALVALGFSKTDASKAVHAVEFTEEITVEEVLKQSLKNIM
ncbi:MAG: Holliday junction branch migration protein RuvA [Lachnospiraceae bacterium]|nr:Holliday junction branch migration protein RuvA [Lachnospiraceae bacterium]